MNNNKMKREYRFIAVTLLLFLTAGCGSQGKEKVEIRNLSLEECCERNLANSALMTGWYCMSDTDSGFVRQLDKTDEFYAVNPFPILTAEDIMTLAVDRNNRGELYLSMKFGKAGTEFWRVATGKSVGKNLALIVNDRLISTPYVNSEITAGVSAFGRTGCTKEEYEAIKQEIESSRAEIPKNK
jgi:preprotein translocase subunit SecD